MRPLVPVLSSVLIVLAIGGLGACTDDGAGEPGSPIPATGDDEGFLDTSLPVGTDPQRTDAPNPAAGGSGAPPAAGSGISPATSAP